MLIILLFFLLIHCSNSSYMEQYYDSMNAILYTNGSDVMVDNYLDATNHCSETGGRVVEIQTEEQQRDVEQFFNNLNINYTLESKKFFIGLRKKFVSITNHRSVLRSPGVTSKIDKVFSFNRNFMYVVNGSLKIGAWNHRHYFLCVHPYQCPNTSHIFSNNRCYKQVSKNVTWYEARNHCTMEGGDVADFDEDPGKIEQLEGIEPHWVGYSTIRWYWETEPAYFANYTNWIENDNRTLNDPCEEEENESYNYDDDDYDDDEEEKVMDYRYERINCSEHIGSRLVGPHYTANNSGERELHINNTFNNINNTFINIKNNNNNNENSNDSFNKSNTNIDSYIVTDSYIDIENSTYNYGNNSDQNVYNDNEYNNYDDDYYDDDDSYVDEKDDEDNEDEDEDKDDDNDVRFALKFTTEHGLIRNCTVVKTSNMKWAESSCQANGPHDTFIVLCMKARLAHPSTVDTQSGMRNITKSAQNSRLVAFVCCGSFLSILVVLGIVGIVVCVKRQVFKSKSKCQRDAVSLLS